MRKQVLAVSLLATLLVPDALRAQVTSSVTFSDPGGLGVGYYDDLERLLTAAVGAWAVYIDGEARLDIRVEFDRVPNVLMYAAASTSVYRYSSGGFSVYDWCTAHEIRTGTDMNGSSADAMIAVNPDFFDDFYFDPNGISLSDSVPWDKYDVYSIFVHEFGHALAFNGWLEDDAGAPVPMSFDEFGNPLPFPRTSRVYSLEPLTRAVCCQKATIDAFARLVPTSTYMSVYDEHVEDNGSTVRFTGATALGVESGGIGLDPNSYCHLADEDSVMHTYAYPGSRESVGEAELAILKDCGMPLNGLAPGVVDDSCLVDTDGDGVGDCDDECPMNEDLTELGECGCELCDDPCALDTDGDGSNDCDDACPFNPDMTELGECGCEDCDDPCALDTDGDGSNDCDDACPFNPDMTELGECGCTPCDSDATGPDSDDPTNTDPVDDDPSDDEVLGDMPDPPPACGSPAAVVPAGVLSAVGLFTRRRKGRSA